MSADLLNTVHLLRLSLDPKPGYVSVMIAQALFSHGHSTTKAAIYVMTDMKGVSSILCKTYNTLVLNIWS